jgi:ubiquinone/menaquinone biosynthesis C-methylase UbiE
MLAIATVNLVDDLSEILKRLSVEVLLQRRKLITSAGRVYRRIWGVGQQSGPRVAAWYDSFRANEKSIGGEMAFWEDLCARHGVVLEVGAGTGAVSSTIATSPLKALTLVEPDIEFCKVLLETLGPIVRADVQYQLLLTPMQNVHLPGQELIIYPFLSWSSIASREEREAVLRSVSRNLAGGGLFVIHETSVEKRRVFLSKSREPVVQGYETKVGYTYRRFFSVPLNDDYFVNFYEFMTEPDGEPIERYFMPVPLVRDGELVELCEALGLRLEAELRKFPKGSGEDMTGRVYMFRRDAR